jgi:hypothetical protein
VVQASAFRWDRASATFATALSQAASADNAERRARETTWKARREAQAVRQRERRGGRPPHAIPPLGRRTRVRFELWLKSAALRYLPPRAVVLMRSLRKVVD